MVKTEEGPNNIGLRQPDWMEMIGVLSPGGLHYHKGCCHNMLCIWMEKYALRFIFATWCEWAEEPYCFCRGCKNAKRARSD